MIKDKNIDPAANIATSKIATTLTGKTLTTATLTTPTITAPVLTLAVQALAAAGSSQSDAGAITATAPGFIVVSASDGTKGVVLPAAAAGKKYTIKNNVNAVLKVYPASGDAINAIAADSAISMAALTCCDFTTADTTTWFTSPLLPS